MRIGRMGSDGCGQRGSGAVKGGMGVRTEGWRVCHGDDVVVVVGL